MLAILLLLMIMLSISFIYASVRINEIELNPAGEDNGNEWVELYSDEQIEINGWKIRSSNGRNMSFNASFSGYYILTCSRNLLTNANNSITLFDEHNKEIDSAGAFSDNANNDKTWQYCNGEWQFIESTKGEDNACEEKINSKTELETNEQVEQVSENEEATIVETNYNNFNEETNETINEQNKVIILKNRVREDNSIIYKSKKEYIREYAPYAFALFCIFIIAILLIEKQRTKIREE